MNLTQLSAIVLQNRETLNNIISDSENINEQVEKTIVSTLDEIPIYDTTGNETKKMKLGVLITHVINSMSSVFLNIGGVEYRLLKKPSNSSPSNQGTLEVGDIITNGYYSDNILIQSARFENTLADGDFTNFGTLANDFQDGNYVDVEYKNW